MATEDSLFHLVHTWANTGALGAVLLLGKWIAGRLVKQLDSKAEQSELDKLSERVDEKADRGTVEEVKADLNRRHDENLAALKRIEDAIVRNDDQASVVRNNLQATMTTLVSQVAKIEGFMAGLQTTSTPPGEK